MKLTFRIHYRTHWGESLCLVSNDPSLAPELAMNSADGDLWSVTVDLSPAKESFDYRYRVRRDDGSVRDEWGDDRSLRFSSHLGQAIVEDRWRDQPSDKPFYSTAFVDCISRRKPEAPLPPLMPSTLMLRLEAPTVMSDQIVAVCGNCPWLGNWNPARAIPLNSAGHPTWAIQLSIPELASEIEFKFVVLDKATRKVIAWEGRDNRELDLSGLAPGESLVLDDLYLKTDLPRWRGAGTAIPVFSLRTDEDFGVGDFLDLIPMIDWAVKTGQKIIQLLPINDTTMTGTWTDSYPYNANSTFALHPMYLRLQEMGQLSDRHRQSSYDALRRQLNELPQVDYERVNNAKNSFTRELFNQQGEAEVASPEYKQFYAENQSWLKPYSAFCILRDRYRTADPSAWEEFAVYDPTRVDRFLRMNSRDADYVGWIQWHLHRQMTRVREYAHANGVALKGDIPIGISRQSVDAWTSPELFNLDASAGAPPDDFSVNGQNWGFPTYNWDVMARDGYAWWKARFRKMAQYFDAYRIDHVLGFFRIWQIPLDAVHGLLGVFNPALPLSPDEMMSSFGFYFERDWMTAPYVHDWMLGDFFGDLADEVKATYLDHVAGDAYRLKPDFSTQRRVADYFAHQDDNERNRRLSDGLMGLIDQVLFIEDPYQKGKYHPRIAAQQTYAYRALDDHRKWAFNQLYDDFFYRRNDSFWRYKAMEKLPPLIDSTRMLVCAEDLGMIPACVPSVMNELKILSLEIQRMPKNPAEEFGNTWNYPYLSVCTTSTHDMSGIRQWWEDDPARASDYFHKVLGHDGEAPYYAEPWICREIVELNLKSPSMLAILPLQDWLSIDGRLRRQDPREEQINVPANPRHYWRYRMHLTVAQLLAAPDLTDSLLRLTAASAR